MFDIVLEDKVWYCM